MGTVQINLLYTLVAALLVFLTGQMLVNRVGFLKRFSIPAPVVGGCLIAVVLAVADSMGGTRVSFDMSLKDNLLLVFFTTVGLAADVRMLIKGGPKLLLFLLLCTVFLTFQNIIGVLAARTLDLHPVVGLIGGSITLAGGHGTGAAYATRFGETMNLQSAMELAMASATAGLILGGILGGPLAEFLIRRHRLTPSKKRSAAAVAAAKPVAGQDDSVTSQSFLATLLIILLCLVAGKTLANLMQDTGFILPDFLFSLLLGVLIRNLATLSGRVSVSDRTNDLIGGVALSLFLIMALMSLRLVDLVDLAGPLLVILALQTVLTAVFVVFVTFRVMGKTYDAAVMAGGQVGFGMGTTAVALAVMKAVTDRSGPSPLAFVIVPVVGAFFMDITNALVIQGFLALPTFGF